MKRVLLAFLMTVVLGSSAFAATCTFSADGIWTTASACLPPTAADDCTINADVDIVMDASSGACGSLTVNGNLLYKPADRTLTIGDGLAAGTSDNITIGSAGQIQISAGQKLLVNTANTTGASRGTITVNGYMSVTGVGLLSGSVTSAVGAVSGSWPDRTVTLTANGLSQVATDALAGKVLVPTTGWFREAWFDITANTQSTVTVRIDGKAAAGTHRGQVDSRNKAGRRDPGVTAGTTYWAPGDWGETIDGGLNGAPATATVASGGTTVTLSGAWSGGVSRLAAFLGSRFICAADISADDDTDVRIIASVTDSTHVVLKTAYPTASCAAGGDFRIWVDNQPPIAAPISETFSVGDIFDVINPAVVGIPSASYSDVTQTAQIDLITVPDGGTFIAKNAEIGNCGHYITGSTAHGCLKATSIDNDSGNEGLYIDRVEFHHYGGVGAIDLEDSANITINEVSIRDAAEGGNATSVAAGVCPGDEAHGIRINDNVGSLRVSGIKVQNGRVVRTNDVSYSPLTAETDGILCADCSLRNMFLGFSPNSCGGSTQCVGIAAGTTNFQGSDIFCTNAPSGYAVSTSTPSTGNGDGYIAWSIFQNSLEGGFKINQTSDVNGTLDANTNFYMVANLFRNLGGADLSGHMVRGRWYSNWIDPANSGANQIISEVQEAKGNVIIEPPNFDSGGSALNHEPTGTARIEPALLREWDNAVLGPTAYLLGSESPFLGGKHGSGNDALASDASFLHNTFIGSEELTSGDNVIWRFRDNGTGVFTVKDNVFANLGASYQRVNGSENPVGDFNLCVKVPAGTCPVTPMTVGASTLTTGILGYLDPANGDFNLAPGSTPANSLGSDSMPRGVRVAGPPSWDRLMRLVPGLGPKPVTINITAAQGGADTDGDGVWDLHDNCDRNFNPAQLDTDGDGLGDACDH